jgi:hypothetical protein
VRRTNKRFSTLAAARSAHVIIRGICLVVYHADDGMCWQDRVDHPLIKAVVHEDLTEVNEVS